MPLTCPWCSALRDSGSICPHCGADYAKAAAIKAHGRAAPIQTDSAQSSAARTSEALLQVLIEEPGDVQTVDDAQLELKFCIGAIPLALLCAMLFQASGLGAMLQRVFLTMPVHELGHAVSAWFCGFTAIPTLWKTLIPDTRGFIAPVILAGAIGYWMYRSWQARNQLSLYACAALLLTQVVGTFIIKLDTAHMLFTFGGDGMGMVLATLLMASFFFGKETQLYKGSLRWGFLVIGAAAFVDIYATWWRSREDESTIPYGTTGGMATDAMKLVDDYGWTLQTLVSRYVTLGLVCLLALALVYAWGVRRAKSSCDERQQVQKRQAWTQRRAGK